MTQTVQKPVIPPVKPPLTAVDPTQFQLYLRLLNYIKPYWVPFVLGIAAAIPSGSMDAAIAWLAGGICARIRKALA